jgi:hypothetical protein
MDDCARQAKHGPRQYRRANCHAGRVERLEGTRPHQSGIDEGLRALCRTPWMTISSSATS